MQRRADVGRGLGVTVEEDVIPRDQDVVEEIGRALGVEYEDAEELKGSEKIEERDRHRWEYDPASAEDYRDRNKKE